MTTLERALAYTIALIERAKIAGDAATLAELLRKKDVICAALAAPERGWS